jgi:hypothetical protein
MNKKELFNDIVALSPSQQEEVALYVSTLKKSTVLPKTDEFLLDMFLDDSDIFIQLEDYSLQSETVDALREIFEDAPSAEDLCAMLTK